MDNKQLALLIDAGINEIITDNKAVFLESAHHIMMRPEIMQIMATERGKQSVIGALMKAAIFGFRLSQELGECHIIPRKMKVKGADGRDQYEVLASFQVGYKGWIKLAFAGGAVESFDYDEVHVNDDFDFEKGSNPFLRFKRNFKSRGEKIGYFACAMLHSGRSVFEYVDMDEVENYRRYSETQVEYGNGGQRTFSQEPKGLWAKSFKVMALRLPIREICTKKIPLTPQIERGIEFDGGVTLQQGKDAQVYTPVEVLQSETPPEVLHEDWIAEIQAKTTREDVRQLIADKAKHLPENLKSAYLTEATKHAQTLPPDEKTKK